MFSMNKIHLDGKISVSVFVYFISDVKQFWN